MLTRRTAAVRLLLAALVAGLVVGGFSTASAAKDNCYEVPDPTGQGTTYICEKPGNDGGGKPGSGGTSSPACTLAGDATFCIGTAACWYTEWGSPWAVPPGTKPSPDAVERVLNCNYVDGGWGARPVWVGGNGEPPLPVQAQEAIGNLTLPTGTLTFSPARRAVVGLPTWFWVTGAPESELTGSSAFGLVAVATPDHLEVDAGDGTGMLNCPWTTSAATAEEACAHAYERASVSGSERVDGQPAYRAGVTAVWSLRFENGGVAVTIPGAQTELRSPQWVRPVPVAEVQALVTVGN